ncbi:hypothetical protein BHE74_00036854 [Ensete ventricosum]|nr:hypothetical protein BHE74_00036854 [Ensete ventricosum]
MNGAVLLVCPAKYRQRSTNHRKPSYCVHMDGYVVCGSSFGRRWNARHTNKHLEVVVVDGCVEEGPSLCVALMPPVRMDESEINSCTYLRRQRNEDYGAVVEVDTIRCDP